MFDVTCDMGRMKEKEEKRGLMHDLATGAFSKISSGVSLPDPCHLPDLYLAQLCMYFRGCVHLIIFSGPVQSVHPAILW